jgi:hypothetical protein
MKARGRNDHKHIFSMDRIATMFLPDFGYHILTLLSSLILPLSFLFHFSHIVYTMMSNFVSGCDQEMGYLNSETSIEQRSWTTTKRMKNIVYITMVLVTEM